MQSELPIAQPPSRLATWLELRAPLDWASVLLRAPQLALAPRGDGRPVLLIPGYRTDERAMRPLGRYLEFLGYDVYDWDQGRNKGDVDGDIQRVGERVMRIYQQLDGEPVTLIGWSLGGVVARETARLFERCVREVITLGTPIIGGPKYTAVASRFARIAKLDLDEFEKEVHERNSIGIRQPVTSIYSRADGVVGWRASIDTYNEQARNIRVNSSHFGLGANGKVWHLIARLLATGVTPRAAQSPASCR